MAYRFDGVDDQIEFAIAPLSGYSGNPITFAILFKRNDTSATDYINAILTAGGGDRVVTLVSSGGYRVFRGANSTAVGALTDTSTWYLVAGTVNSSNVCRIHIHDGVIWGHNAASSVSAAAAIAGTDRLFVGSANGAVYFNADIVCAGFKKADSSDAAVETLSRTSFQAWRDFGFDWLIGFDTSLEAAGILQDQGNTRHRRRDRDHRHQPRGGSARLVVGRCRSRVRPPDRDHHMSATARPST